MLPSRHFIAQAVHRYASIAGLALALAGCAALSPQPPQDAGPQIERQYHDTISLGGRLSIQYAQNGQEQAVHGSFTWDQHNSHIVLSMLSPLGQTLATIDMQPGLAVLQQSGKPPMSAADVDILTEQALGWPLPVAGLRNWLQGFGRDAAGKTFVAQPSIEPRHFTTADGWKLTYGDWQDDAANTVQNRPKRIDLARETQQAGPVGIRIVIDKWQTGADTAGQ